jgi:hypothetical protein
MFWVVLSRLAAYWSKAGRAAPTDKGSALILRVQYTVYSARFNRQADRKAARNSKIFVLQAADNNARRIGIFQPPAGVVWSVAPVIGRNLQQPL